MPGNVPSTRWPSLIDKGILLQMLQNILLQMNKYILLYKIII
jgi:hypothetical protein